MCLPDVTGPLTVNSFPRKRSSLPFGQFRNNSFQANMFSSRRQVFMLMFTFTQLPLGGVLTYSYIYNAAETFLWQKTFSRYKYGSWQAL